MTHSDQSQGTTLSPADMAQIIHEALRAYAHVSGQEDLPAWEDAPEWMKASTLDGVEHYLSEPDLTQEDIHARWVADKKAHGWRFGPEKDSSRKTHPMIIDYADVPEVEKLKDRIFLKLVEAMRPDTQDLK